MTTTEKLKLMQEIKAVNDARVQECADGAC